MATSFYFLNQSTKCIYKALFTLADVTKCCTETQPKTSNSKQCRCRSTVATKNYLFNRGIVSLSLCIEHLFIMGFDCYVYIAIISPAW